MNLRASIRGLGLVSLYGALLVGGFTMAQKLTGYAPLGLNAAGEVYLGWAIVGALALYVLVMAFPFVPGAEIGLGLMLMFGPRLALLVYGSTVLSLTLAYLVGRAIPASACAAAFDLLGLRKARDLVRQTAALDVRARLQLLLAAAPKRAVSTLLCHRYLALAVALNLPGNALIGGGGGIALSAGMSRLYPMPAFVATVAAAVAPVPLVVALSSLLA